MTTSNTSTVNASAAAAAGKKSGQQFKSHQNLNTIEKATHQMKKSTSRPLDLAKQSTTKVVKSKSHNLLSSSSSSSTTTKQQTNARKLKNRSAAEAATAIDSKTSTNGKFIHTQSYRRLLNVSFILFHSTQTLL